MQERGGLRALVLRDLLALLVPRFMSANIVGPDVHADCGNTRPDELRLGGGLSRLQLHQLRDVAGQLANPFNVPWFLGHDPLPLTRGPHSDQSTHWRSQKGTNP